MAHGMVLRPVFLTLVTTLLVMPTLAERSESFFEGNHEKILKGAENTIAAVKKEHCCSLECLNGGGCRLGSDGEESCLCPVGYTGRLCDVQIQVGYCEPNPCQNNGTCVFLLGGYVCSCTVDSSGRNCEIAHSAGFYLTCNGQYLFDGGGGAQRLYLGNYSKKVVNGTPLPIFQGHS